MISLQILFVRILKIRITWIGWKIRRLKSSYEVISAFDDILTNGIQAQQLQWKKCVDHNEDHIEKLILFGHIPW